MPRFEGGSITLVKDGKANTVEASKPLFGAKPEIPILCLCDGPNGVLREPLIITPHVLYILRQGLIRVERMAMLRKPIMDYACNRQREQNSSNDMEGTIHLNH